MRGIIEYINETLSNDNIKKLSDYITDDNFDLVFPKIQKLVKEADLIGEDFKKFFTNKGLDNKSFDDDKEAEIGLRISSYFADENKNDILKKIVSDNGVESFDDIYKGNNIFKFCNKFKDIARKISLIKNVTSHGANVGKFEILIKFLLKEDKAESDYGDISIKYKNNDKFIIEVKGGNTLPKAGAVCGQAIKSTEQSSSKFLNILNITSEDISFLGSANANKRLEKVLNDNNINDIKIIISSFVKSIAYQYSVENEEYINSFTNNLINYNEENKIFEVKDNKVNIKSLTNILGITQLYFYSKKDKWDAIFVVNQTNGDYVIVKENELLEFDSVFEKVNFYPGEGNTSATGRRCISRIFVK